MFGVAARSVAISPAEPRRKANGEAAIRPTRSGTSEAIRPSFADSTESTTLGRSAAGANSACALRGVFSRSSLPTRSAEVPSTAWANPATTKSRFANATEPTVVPAFVARPIVVTSSDPAGLILTISTVLTSTVIVGDRD